MFAVLLALLSASMAYSFGVGNQEEHIPIVLRQLDPGYLIEDFFVSSTVQFGPRFYFAELVALLARWMPVEAAYYLLRFASDLALVIVTMWAARRVIGADRLAGRMAAVLTVAVSGFHLGDAADLRYGAFVPASLAIPGMLLAIGLGLRGRPIAAAVAASAASLPHPLYGLYGGLLGISAGGVALLLPQQGAVRRWGAALVPAALGATVFAGSMLAFWWLPSRGTDAAPLASAEVLAILGRFRAPHHYFPSHFRPQDYVTTIAFLAASTFAFRRWARGAADDMPLRLACPLGLIAAACIAATLFTEVWPAGAAVALQPFRLLSVVKWVGYLLLAWLLAGLWQRPPDALARPVVGLSLLSAGATYPLVTAAGLSLMRLQPALSRYVNASACLIALVCGAAVLSLYVGSYDERARLFAAAGLLALTWQPRTYSRVLAAAVVIVVGIGMGDRLRNASAPGPFHPIFTADGLRGARADAARAAARHSPPDAVFVAPPGFGLLRIVGRRALVVDFEAIPYQGASMREWRERIRRAYGDVEEGGLAARDALDRAYRRITDAQLLALADRYGATHAVLYAGTTTTLPELHADGAYRVVRLRRQ